MHNKVIKFTDDIDLFRAVKMRTTCEELQKGLVRLSNNMALKIQFGEM